MSLELHPKTESKSPIVYPVLSVVLVCFGFFPTIDNVSEEIGRFLNVNGNHRLLSYNRIPYINLHNTR